jgi:hypothetical protein
MKIAHTHMFYYILSDYERDLGVNFETNLKWRQRIISCASKANSMMGILKMTFVHIDPYLLKILNTSFIRPNYFGSINCFR